MLRVRKLWAHFGESRSEDILVALVTIVVKLEIRKLLLTVGYQEKGLWTQHRRRGRLVSASHHRGKLQEMIALAIKVYMHNNYLTIHSLEFYPKTILLYKNKSCPHSKAF